MTMLWIPASVTFVTLIYGLPLQGKRLIDSCGKRGEPAVVYPASEVGS
jgi:hypothetical protein